MSLTPDQIRTIASRAAANALENKTKSPETPREKSLRLQGEEIVRQLDNGVNYRGPWLPEGPEGELLGHFFQDDAVTQTSFVCQDITDCKAKLIKVREDFKAAPPVFTQEAGRVTPVTGGVTKISTELQPLAQEAIKYDTFEDFQTAFLREIKHGRYYHVTDNPNFTISPELGPRDMSSMAGEAIPEKGKLMITSDLDYWAEEYKGTRQYVAIIDVSQVPKEKYWQVNRGFGNEFWVDDPSMAKVIKVVPMKQAKADARLHHKALPGSKEELEAFYNQVKGIKLPAPPSSPKADFTIQEKVNPCPNLQPMAEWIKGEEPGTCRPCTLSPVVQWYYEELKEKGHEDIAADLESLADDLEEDNMEQVMGLCQYLDEIKSSMPAELRKRLEEFDCAVQSFNPDEASEEVAPED